MKEFVKKAYWMTRNLQLWMIERFAPEENIRPIIQFIKDNYKHKDLVGVEIGVAKDENAENMLMFLPIKKLYLIDPYLQYDDLKEKYGADDASHKAASSRLHKYKDKGEFVVKMAEDAVDDIPDDVDFVYIDGNHSYEYVKKDLELYYPKVKGGACLVVMIIVLLILVSPERFLS